jgi:protein-S-isoprenylcysteine O-methyltransferase Ste14
MGVKLILFSVVSTAGYFALAILGWDGWTPFFAHPPLVALAVVTVLIVTAAAFTEVNLSKGEREDHANRWVLPAFGVLGLASAYLPAYTDRIGFWTVDGDALRWLGVTLYALGGVVRLWPVFVLGRRFSGLVAIQPGHALVTTGIYRVIRHPSYLGMMMLSLGWALAFRSVLGVVLVVLMIVPLVGRINAEERLLRSQFGREYDAYRVRTSRLIPGIY